MIMKVSMKYVACTVLLLSLLLPGSHLWADRILIGHYYSADHPLDGNGSFEDQQPYDHPLFGTAELPIVATNSDTYPATIPGWICYMIKGFVGWAGIETAAHGNIYGAVNNNSAGRYLSDPVTHDLLSGDVLELTFMVTTSVDGGTHAYTLALIFDIGQATEHTVSFPEKSITTAVKDEYQTISVSTTVIDAARTVSVQILADNAGNIAENDVCRFDDVSLVVVDPGGKASIPFPALEDDVAHDVLLAWNPGAYAVQHDVYLGTDFNEVNNATRALPLGVLQNQAQTVTTFDPGPLDFGQQYFWRIDEVNAPPDATIYKGNIWRFEVEPLARPIATLTATASSETEDPSLTIDGSGLDEHDGHSVSKKDMWLGSPTGNDPVWVQYVFDKAYELYEIWIWNHNSGAEGVLGYGFKDVIVTYSQDGTDWIELGQFEFIQATGAPGYTPNTIITGDGISAKFIRLTANSNWSLLGLPQAGLSEVRFYAIPRHARKPQPFSGAVNVDPRTTLSWRAGRDAESHDVYLSSDPQSIGQPASHLAKVTDSYFDPQASNLLMGETYHWAIHETSEATMWPGDTWHFTTSDYVTIDDFEKYNNIEETGTTIYQTWIDGWDQNNNNGQAGHLDPPFAEVVTVHTGQQSFPFYYNTKNGLLSEATRTFQTEQDWTRAGATQLVVFIHGQASNQAGRVYAKINGSQTVYADVAASIQENWTRWVIDLDGISSRQNVRTLTLGVTDTNNNVTGIVYVDDIRLYRTLE